MQTTPEIHKDPVCGMDVEGGAARERGLTRDHEGSTYYFCGKGCMLEFRDGPAQYLDPNYEPRMM